jgi:histidinol-phosphate phosphatase family protein
MHFQIDTSWTLFLDRDGVINRRPLTDYVKSWEEFEFLPGTRAALCKLAAVFSRIIIVTNQQGIGKNLMTTEDLTKIHQRMCTEIEKHGGRIDQIYFCPDLAAKPASCRKPGIKMAQQAKEDHPDIDFSRSIMAGDTAGDMKFGIHAGMKTVYINTNITPLDSTLYTAEFPDLISFAESLSAND